MAGEQARLAVDSRAFPLLIYDPRAGESIKKRLSLQGNPAMKEDWYTNPKTGDVVDFIDFADGTSWTRSAILDAVLT